MTSTHPPIPPNCDFFEEDVVEGKHCFGKPCTCDVCGGDLIDLENPNHEWRPIIAAVARCAWGDEADAHMMDSLLLAHPDSIDESQKEYDAYQQARDNAQAWAEWGRQ